MIQADEIAKAMGRIDARMTEYDGDTMPLLAASFGVQWDHIMAAAAMCAPGHEELFIAGFLTGLLASREERSDG